MRARKCAATIMVILSSRRQLKVVEESSLIRRNSLQTFYIYFSVIYWTVGTAKMAELIPPEFTAKQWTYCKSSEPSPWLQDYEQQSNLYYCVVCSSIVNICRHDTIKTSRK